MSKSLILKIMENIYLEINGKIIVDTREKEEVKVEKTFDLQSEFNKEFRRLLSSYKTVRFLDSNGNVSTIPTQRVELLDEDDKWLFDYNLEKEHFWFSYWKILPILESKFSIDYPQIQQLMLPVLEEDFKLKGVTPMMQMFRVY